MKKRAASNIIATLIIFTIMVSALGLAFSQIIPSLERFQTSSDLTAATNEFLGFDNAIKHLINAPDNTTEILKYDLSTGILDLENKKTINISLLSFGKSIFNYTSTLGELVYKLDGNYAGQGGAIYDFGNPLLLVYSINRTSDVTNIVRQIFDNYILLSLFYDIFLSIETVAPHIVEVSFIVVHLTTIRSVNNQGEYFPIVNTEKRIQLLKLSQDMNSYYVGNYSSDLNVKAESSIFAQTINYELAPSTYFDLYVNIVDINIDFRTI